MFVDGISLLVVLLKDEAVLRARSVLGPVAVTTARLVVRPGRCSENRRLYSVTVFVCCMVLPVSVSELFDAGKESPSFPPSQLGMSCGLSSQMQLHLDCHCEP